MNRYEALLILDIKGTEDKVKEIIDRLEGDFRKDGAQIESIQKLDRRHFTYVAQKLDNGYYVNIIFAGTPETLVKLTSRFKLDNEVFRQTYTKLPAKKVEAAA